jgi:histidinol dehydrogenase
MLTADVVAESDYCLGYNHCLPIHRAMSRQTGMAQKYRFLRMID